MSPDVAASVRARLLNQAKARGEEFERTLARFAGERLLFRLGACAARDRCILKGASLLAVWMPDPYRATRDVDVLASGPTDDAAIRSLIAEICAVDCAEDGLRFDLSELVVEAIRAEEEYSGRRARFRAFLGQARSAVQLDIGVGDALVIEPEEIDYPTMLASLPAPRLRAYPREQAVAEKFEAMVKLDTQNSRMKDFHDIWALAGAFDFDGTALQKAVAACFERRRTRWTEEGWNPAGVAGAVGVAGEDRGDGGGAWWCCSIAARTTVLCPSPSTQPASFEPGRVDEPSRRTTLRIARWAAGLHRRNALGGPSIRRHLLLLRGR